MLERATIELMKQRFEQYEQERRDDIMSPLAALSTTLEIVAYVIEVARKDGSDEADAVQLMLEMVDTDRQTLREYAATLKLLGYRDVSDRLQEMARQRWRKAGPSTGRLAVMLAPRHREAMQRERTALEKPIEAPTRRGSLSEASKAISIFKPERH